MAKFTEQIQAWVLASEGGYVDHYGKNDNGSSP